MYLTLENVTKVFPPHGNVGEVIAVHDVSLEIQKGELVTLLGPSGCGKTSFLSAINRLTASRESLVKGRRPNAG